jgi:prolyl oligopeptidase
VACALGFVPTLLVGYGAYGVTLDPSFNSMGLAWLERGGVFAVAHVRGGGELGEEWHLAGSGTSAGGILIGRAIAERPDLLRAAVPRVGVMNALRVEHEPGGKANIPEFGTTTT